MVDKRIYYDVETTGFSSLNHGITEIGAIYVEDGEIKDEINLFINPNTYKKKIKVVNEAIEFRGVTLEDLNKYPNAKESFNKLIKWLDSKCDKFNAKDKLTLVGYNSDIFDVKFLKEYFNDNGHKYFGSYFNNDMIDVMKLVKQKGIKKKFNLKDNKLLTIANHYNIEINPHIAMDDIRATYYIHREIEMMFDYTKMIDILNKEHDGEILSNFEKEYFKLHSKEMNEWFDKYFGFWKGDLLCGTDKIMWKDVLNLNTLQDTDYIFNTMGQFDDYVIPTFGREDPLTLEITDKQDAKPQENLQLYEIWMGGYAINSESGGDSKIGEEYGVDFDDAVRKYQEKHNHKFDYRDGMWYDWGCTITPHCLGRYPNTTGHGWK